MSIDRKHQRDRIFQDLLDQLPDEKFAKPQLDLKPTPQIDIAMAVEQALAEPLFYPPLRDSIFPGDSIAIVLQADLPHAREILDTVLGQLEKNGIETADLNVVIARSMARQFELDTTKFEIASDPQAEPQRPPQVPVDVGSRKVNFQIHDPANTAGLAYIVANAEGDPVYINRLLVDADVVLPIGFPSAGEVSQQLDCIYPEFSSETARAKFADGTGSFLSRRTEIELANDSLGAFFLVQIVFGQGDAISQVISGARKDAAEAARTEVNKLWAFEWDGDSDVTVATVESTGSEQTWDDFASALIAASRVSSGESPIVVWTQLATKPDRKIRKACLSQFESGISSKMTKTAQHVAAIVNERPVYLHCQLQQSVIEELGLGFVETADQIVRIAQSRGRGLVIRDAHKCQISGTVDVTT